MRVFSRKSTYGLRAMCHLAARYNTGRVVISELAEKEHVPPKFLEAILLELNQAGLLDSRKGRHGGYQLAVPPGKITLNAVITALEGPFSPLPCTGIGKATCEECSGPGDCPMRLIARSLKREIDGHLDGISIEDLLARSQAPSGADASIDEEAKHGRAERGEEERYV